MTGCVKEIQVVNSDEIVYDGDTGVGAGGLEINPNELDQYWYVSKGQYSRMQKFINGCLNRDTKLNLYGETNPNLAIYGY